MATVSTESISPDRIRADLAGLGVAPGDLLMVHTSMRAVGPVDGGAAGLIHAIRGAVGPKGTILVNVGVLDEWAWVNDHPEHERAALLADADPFVAATTPADPDNGVFAEIFRRAPDADVSDHPEGRFAAIGPLAGTLLADVPWDDYYGPGSPLQRFVEHRGKVLRLGADLDTVTLLHFAEHVVDHAPKRRVRRHRKVATETGIEIRVVDTLDDSDNIVDLPGEDYFARITRDYLATGRASIAPVGNATAELIDGADLVAFAVRWMEQHFPARPNG